MIRELLKDYTSEERRDEESMTMPELACEIEKQKYNLHCLKTAKLGKEDRVIPINWQDLVEQATERLQQLRLSLEQRMWEVLGVPENERPCDDDQPREFQDGGFAAWAAGRDLESADDVLAFWHLSDCFPFGLSIEKLNLIEQTLKAQTESLEAEEAACEDRNALDFRHFLMDIRSTQLEQVQNLRCQYDYDSDLW